MIVKWNNNIVDYKCKVFFFFFFYATKPSFFFMLVYVFKKREHATYDIRDSYYKPVAPPCVDVTRPHHHTERVSNLGLRCGMRAL